MKVIRDHCGLFLITALVGLILGSSAMCGLAALAQSGAAPAPTSEQVYVAQIHVIKGSYWLGAATLKAQFRLLTQDPGLIDDPFYRDEVATAVMLLQDGALLLPVLDVPPRFSAEHEKMITAGRYFLDAAHKTKAWIDEYDAGQIEAEDVVFGWYWKTWPVIVEGIEVIKEVNPVPDPALPDTGTGSLDDL